MLCDYPMRTGAIFLFFSRKSLAVDADTCYVKKAEYLTKVCSIYEHNRIFLGSHGLSLALTALAFVVYYAGAPPVEDAPEREGKGPASQTDRHPVRRAIRRPVCRSGLQSRSTVCQRGWGNRTVHDSAGDGDDEPQAHFLWANRETRNVADVT